MVSKFSSALIFVALTFSGAHAEEVKQDQWQPVRFLVGDWQGTVSGRAGLGTVTRSYEFVLGDKFIQERNTSSYPPQETNKTGEVHHHLSFISYDKQRKTLMLRQFHEESFVILYAFNPSASTPTSLVFESEQFENFDNSWKARETYEIASDNEFIEIFALAPPGKPLEVYSRNQFKRVP